MKAIVIYKSNTGLTKKCAEWIAEELSCKAVPMEEINGVNLASYDTLVFGGWLLAGSIQGLKQIKSKIISFKGKKAIFATGSMPSDSPPVADIMGKCLTEEEHKEIGTFYMRGGLNYDKMGFIHKSMMKMMCNIMKKQHGVDSEQYKSISKSFDATSKSAVEPLIQFVKS